jgi:hypothetical protein
MKPPLALLALLSLALFSGCESLSDATTSVREKLAAREQPRTHVYRAPQRATYEAARVAVEQMGFRLVRGGAAQGELDAVSGLSSSDTLRGSRQITLKLRLRAALDGGTEAALRLTEVIESDSRGRAGQGTETPLRDTPLYEVFFRNVQVAIDAPKKG